jgi:rRNA maturation protein Nop10
MDKIEFELFENGLDFIASGLDHISRAQDKRDLKYGVLHLASGVELVLKARLEREDWALLFLDPGQADDKRFRSGNFKSIGLDDCFDRLRDNCNIIFTPATKGALTSFRNRRNRFEHFSITDTKEAIEASSVPVLNAVLDFVSREFGNDELTHDELQLLESIRRQLGEFTRFTQEKLREIAPRIKEEEARYGRFVTCPQCVQQTLHADIAVDCFFCGYRDESEAAAELYITNVLGESRYRALKDGGEYPLYDCPECCNKTLVDNGPSGDMAPSVQFICFGCGARWMEGQLEACPECGKMTNPDRIFAGRCNDCTEAYLQRDNT